MKKAFFLIILIYLSTGLEAQKRKEGIEHSFAFERVKEATSVVWYGWDFSHSSMRDLGKFQEGELILGRHIPAILGRLESEYSAERVGRHLKKEVTFDPVSVQDLYLKMDAKRFIVPRYTEISIDSIKSIVWNYSLPQREGLGFVVILEMMNTERDMGRFVTGYLTFFDIKTREVFYSVRMKGLPGSKWGFDDYWFNGLTELYAYFIRDFYGKKIK